MNLILKEESYGIMGACFEVFSQMRNGLIEPIYHECLIREFEERNIPALHEANVPVFYKQQKLSRSCRLDFLCFGKVIVELKSVKFLDDSRRSQVHSYLRATGLELGLLVNFGTLNEVEWERIVRSKSPTQQSPNSLGMLRPNE